MPDILDRRRTLYRPKKKRTTPSFTQAVVLKIVGNFPNGGNFHEIYDKVIQECYPCTQGNTWTAQRLLHNAKKTVLTILHQLIQDHKIKTSTVDYVVLYHKVISHNEVMIIEED